MALPTQRVLLSGPAGTLECAIDLPDCAERGVAVICHPNPVFGGTLDNKVVQTLVRALVQLGWRCVRFNFRGVGASEGTWDEGRGEVDDAMAVVQAQRAPGQPLVLAGFSFGGYVACEAASRLALALSPASHLVLVGPSTQNHRLSPAACPNTLVVHGECDEVVPLSHTLDWARAQTLPVVVMPGAGHFFHGQLSALKNVVLAHALGWQML
jgi:uncharacterized protein